MKSKLLTLVSAALVIIASVVTSTATIWIFYQPRTPKALLRLG